MTGRSVEDADWDATCLANLLAATPYQLYFKDRESRFVRVSNSVVRGAAKSRQELRGLPVRSANDLLGKSDFDVFVEETARRAYASEQAVMRTGEPLVEVIERQTWPNRAPTYVSTTKLPLRSPEGDIIGTFGFSRDVTDDTVVRRQLAHLLESSPDAIMRLDRDLCFAYVNPAAEAMLGRASDEIVGEPAFLPCHEPEIVELWGATLRRVVDKGEPAQLEHVAGVGDARRHYDSRIVPELDGDYVTGVLVMTRDITDRKNAELALAEQAVHDPLTGLANRVLLRDRLAQSLLRLDRAPGTIAVLFLDLNRFKLINDTLGHAVGDALLNEVAMRLRALARRSDTVARFGGDEFVILCDRVATTDDAKAIAERVAEAVARPFVHAGRTLHVTASVGIATSANPGADPEHLLRDADTAMYQAKELSHGAGRYQMFDPDARACMVSRLDTENDLRAAIETGGLTLHYQPLHVLDSGQLHGVEALVRWPHPTRGLLMPNDFIPIAEQSGLIIDLGAWVVEEACRQLAEWTAARGPDRAPLTMAVNISARQLASPLLPAQVRAALTRHRIPPGQLCLEITETAMLEEAVSSVEALRRLRALGVRIALDDFGTGYSSLAHLRRFRVDTLKIDRSFVSGLDDEGGDTAIVAAITAMASALGMTTIGEGIETPGQMARLRDLGCTGGQGFHLARPRPAEDLAWLVDHD